MPNIRPLKYLLTERGTIFSNLAARKFVAVLERGKISGSLILVIFDWKKLVVREF
jgi:hypothetical protein